MPRVHPTAYIDDSAQVIGDVEIGEESSVWMSVVIRGDVHRIRIGRRTNVQDGTDRARHAGHAPDDDRRRRDDRARARSSTAARSRTACLIGMGAILLNGVARSATDSIVAAGSLVVEGMDVPPRSLVMGSPAQGASGR